MCFCPAEDTFLSAIINYTNSSTVHFKLSPTYVLYMACRYVLSPSYRPDMSPSERTHKVIAIVNKMVSMMEGVIQVSNTTFHIFLLCVLPYLTFCHWLISLSWCVLLQLVCPPNVMILVSYVDVAATMFELFTFWCNSPNVFLQTATLVVGVSFHIYKLFFLHSCQRHISLCFCLLFVYLTMLHSRGVKLSFAKTFFHLASACMKLYW